MSAPLSAAFSTSTYVMFARVPANTEGTGSAKTGWAMHAAAHIIEFKDNGEFVEQKGEEQSSVPLFNAYKILDNNRIEMIPIDKKNPSHIWFYSDLTAGKVTLGYGCIEACSGKYVAVE